MRPRFLPHSLLFFALLITVFLFGRFNHAAAQLPPLTHAELTAAGVDPALLRAAALAVTVSATNSGPTVIGQVTTLTATVNVTDTSGLTFAWILGDGQAARGSVVRYTYPRTGEFEAWVIVSDGTNVVSARTRVTIVVEPTPAYWPPTGLQAGSNAPQEAGIPIQFWATVERGTAVVYTWDFGDGSPLQTGATVSHIYAEVKSYTVTVVASNASDRTPPVYLMVNVTEATLEGLDFTYTPANIVVGRPVFFQTKVDRGTNVWYEWSFGDGTLVTTKETTISHTFDIPAKREVRVRAYNSISEQTLPKSIIIGSTPPTNLNVFVVDPVLPSREYTLVATVSSLTKVSVYWNLGDGQLQMSALAELPADRTGYQVSTSYAYDGRAMYPLVVTAHNEAGSIQERRIIYVNVPKPPQDLLPTYSPKQPKVGQPVSFSVPVLFGQECQWAFRELESVGTASGQTALHTFTKPGFHIISVVCTNPPDSVNQSADFIVLVTIDTYMPIIAGGNANAANVAPTPEPTIAPIPTATSTPTPTATPTATPTSTATPTNTATNTATPTHTPTPTDTVTATPLPTPTPTATETATPTPTATLTETPTETPTPTLVGAETLTPTVTATETLLPATATETVTPTATDPSLGGTIPPRP